MKIKFSVFFMTLFLIFSGVSQGLAVTTSNIDDQIAVTVTIYNNNLALINEIRRIEIPVDEGELRFTDVPSHIIPASVYAKSVDNEREFHIVEQNYEYDLLNKDTMLDKYVGKKIKIVDWNKYKDRKEVTEAVLLSNNNGQIYKIGNEIFIGHPGYKVLPGVPGGLIEKPTLKWIYKSCGSKSPYDLNICYLTKNISWKSDYVIILDKNDTSGDMSGNVTIDNKSGVTFENTLLKLIAGEIHQAEIGLEDRLYAKRALRKGDSAQFKDKSFFEYHAYDLQRKTTIKDKQTKQINLLRSKGLRVGKELVVYGSKGYFTKRYIGQKIRQPVNVYIQLKNSKENNLGMPLPAGTVRLYKKNNHEGLIFVGEDRIKHIPEGEEVRLNAGEAFDVFAERIQTDYKQTTTRLHESVWEVILRNHKEKEVNVGIIEPLSGNWSVVDSTHTFKKIDAFTIRFDVVVPMNKEVKIRYRAKVGL